MRRRILDERGQTSSEHLGVMVLVAAIIVALLATDIPAAIGGGISDAICRITGGDCESPEGSPDASLGPDSDGDGIPDGIETDNGTDPNNPDTDGDGLNDMDEYTFGTDPLNPDSDGDGYSDNTEYDNYEPNNDPCVVDNKTIKGSVSLTLFSAKGGHSLEAKVDTMSDGRILVTVQGSGELGAELESGIAGISGVVKTTGGFTFAFDDAEHVSEFTNDLATWAIGTAIENGVPAGNIMLDVMDVGDDVYNLANDVYNTGADVANFLTPFWDPYPELPDIEIPDPDDIDFPSPEEVYFQGGLEVAGGLGGGAGVAYADVEGVAGAALGGKYNFRTNETTLYYELTLQEAASAGILVGGEVDGRGKITVGLVLDENMNPTQLKLTGRGEGRVAGTLGGQVKVPGAEIDLRAKAGVSEAWEAETTLALDNAADRDAALTWLASHAGLAVPGIGVPNFVASSADLAGALAERGRFTFKNYEGEYVGTEAGATILTPVGNFGLEGSNEISQERLQDAYGWQPNVGTHELDGCPG